MRRHNCVATLRLVPLNSPQPSDKPAIEYTVIVVDDHPIFREAMCELLTDAHFQIVSQASEGGAAVDLALKHKPHLMVIDVMLPGMDGLAATRAIKDKLPDTQVMVVSGDDSDATVFGAIDAGASAFLLKDSAADVMAEAAQQVVEGRAYLPPTIAKRIMGQVSKFPAGKVWQKGRSASTPLSSRELSVLRHMAEGRRNREIARSLSISERTVGNYITSIYDKLALYDRAQAIIYAIKNGLVQI